MLGELRLSPQGCAPQQPPTGVLSSDGTPFYLKGGFMHPNELKVNDHIEQLTAEAEKLGDRHIAALKEQIERQNTKTK